MKYIKKYNESSSGPEKEELDLEYVKNCLIYFFDENDKNDNTEVHFKWELHVKDPLNLTFGVPNSKYIIGNWVSGEDSSHAHNLIDKRLIGIQISHKIKNIPNGLSIKNDNFKELSDWSDDFKRLSNTIVGSVNNIKEEYPNYIIDCYYSDDEYSDRSLYFQLEVKIL